MNNWHDDLDKAVEKFLQKEAAKNRVRYFTNKYPGPKKIRRPWTGSEKFGLWLFIILTACVLLGAFL